MATVAAYIDGFNLYYGMKSKFARRYLWLDLVELMRRLRPEDEVTAVRYYTALVRSEPEAAARQKHYLEALQSHSGPTFHLQLGWFKPKKLAPCKLCSEDWLCQCPRKVRSYEEKETDVALAAAMVADAANGLADLTLLVSADSDFAPAVRAVKLVQPAQQVILAMPPGNPKPHKRFTDVGYFSINETALRRSQLPEAIYDPKLRAERRRPEKWI
ncbi:NYN domain-containing protein [Kribbella monticola]|uniref:NYN domain-containing protein n=1 Tax=Kribbella monticola TaxID=2185285 RepID=UPI000DD41640|nr:NYN domain-containing protein [Kribbella monticola]